MLVLFLTLLVTGHCQPRSSWLLLAPLLVSFNPLLALFPSPFFCRPHFWCQHASVVIFACRGKNPVHRAPRGRPGLW